MTCSAGAGESAPLCPPMLAPRVTPALLGPLETASVSGTCPCLAHHPRQGPRGQLGSPRCHARPLRTRTSHLRSGGGWRTLTFSKSHLFFPVILAVHHRVEGPGLRRGREGCARGRNPRVPSPRESHGLHIRLQWPQRWFLQPPALQGPGPGTSRAARKGSSLGPALARLCAEGPAPSGVTWACGVQLLPWPESWLLQRPRRRRRRGAGVAPAR